jgi:hypothetical protein
MTFSFFSMLFRRSAITNDFGAAKISSGISINSFLASIISASLGRKNTTLIFPPPKPKNPLWLLVQFSLILANYHIFFKSQTVGQDF